MTDLGPWVVESVSAEAMRELAKLFADPNPIHLDPAAALAAGLGPCVVNQGPASYAYVVNMLREAHPDAEIRRLRFRFLSPVRAGDRVVAAGRVIRREPCPGGELLAYEVWLDVEGAGRAIEGSAKLMLPGASSAPFGHGGPRR